MGKDIVSIEGRRHPLVKAFQEFYEGLEGIVGNDDIILSSFTPISGGQRDPEYIFRGIDEKTGYMKIVGKCNGYSQEFRIRLKEETAKKLQNFLQEYNAL